MSNNDDWRNYVPPEDRGEGEAALPRGVGRRSGGSSDRTTALPAPLGARPTGANGGKRGARIKRSIVYVHADRDEHVDAETAKDIGVVLKNSTEWIRFDSKREAKRFVSLRTEQKAGTIHGLERQVKFPLLVRGPDKMDRMIATWTADFVYYRVQTGHEVIGKRVVEDCKGMRTEIYQRSKKHFEAQYGITITES